MAEDTPLPGGTAVTLDVEGGKVMGPATTETEDDVASFIVSTDNVRTLRLTAHSNSMATKRSIILKKQAAARAKPPLPRLATSQISPPDATSVATGGDLHTAIFGCIPEEQRMQNLL